MSALVVDTSSWISYFAGGEDESIDNALQEARIQLPPIVAAELLSGKMTPHQRRALEGLLRDLPTCESNLDHWFRVGRLRRRLFEHGLSVSTPDAHVAQCALDLKAELLSEDRVFRRIADHAALRLI